MADQNISLDGALDEIEKTAQQETQDQGQEQETTDTQTETDQSEQQTSTSTDDQAENDPSKQETTTQDEGEKTGKEGTEGDQDDPKKDQQEDSSVIRNLRKQQKEARTERDKYYQNLEKIAKAQDLTVDQLVEKLQDDTDKQQAEKQNISPEVQKQLREQQEKLSEMQEERQREQFQSRAEKLASSKNLDQDGLRSFVKEAYNNGFDLMNPNVSFEAAYNAVHHETLVEQARKEERQKVYAEIEKQQSRAPGTVSRSGTEQSGGKIKGVDNALKDLGL